MNWLENRLTPRRRFACEEFTEKATCSCTQCKPRTARQRALLLTARGKHGEARKVIDEALWLCAESGQLDYQPRILSSRGVVLFYAGEIEAAIESGRAAKRNLGPRKDGIHYLIIVQRLSVFLMASGARANWEEAWAMLGELCPGAPPMPPSFS